jgi:hypothetical protein
MAGPLAVALNLPSPETGQQKSKDFTFISNQLLFQQQVNQEWISGWRALA